MVHLYTNGSQPYCVWECDFTFVCQPRFDVSGCPGQPNILSDNLTAIFASLNGKHYNIITTKSGKSILSQATKSQTKVA